MRKYYSETKFGHRIVDRFVDSYGTVYVIVERVRGVLYSTDYILGCDYDDENGCWQQGYYDFSTKYKAEKFLKQNYTVKRI